MNTPTTVAETAVPAADASVTVPPVRVPAESSVGSAGHLTLLVLAVLVLGLSFVLGVRGEEQVTLPVFNVPLPALCSFKRATGLDCPGCGLTRCFISLAQGDLPRAWQFNPAGIFFFAMVVAQIPFRGWQLWRLQKGGRAIDLGWWGHGTLLLFAALLIGQWLVRIVDRFL